MAKQQVLTQPKIPAIATPAALELRAIQSAIDNIREGLQALQGNLSTVVSNTQMNTQARQTSNAAINALAGQIKTMQGVLDALSAAVKSAPQPTNKVLVLFGDDEGSSDDSFLIPQADPTPGDAPDYVELPAGIALGGNRAVRMSAGGLVYADNATLADANLVLGITRFAVGAGDYVQVQTHGLMRESSWAWTADQPVFVGAGGVLTQASPASGFTLVIGIATATDQIHIGAKVPIVLI